MSYFTSSPMGDMLNTGEMMPEVHKSYDFNSKMS